MQFNKSDIEQTRLLYGHLPFSICTNLILALILVYIQRSVIELAIVLGWLISICLVMSYRTVLMIRWHQNKICDAASISSWKYYFRIGVFATGLTWSIGSILLFPVGNIPHQVFLGFVIAGLAAGGITALSVDKISVFSFLSLILMPLIVRFGMEDSEISLSMGIMTALFLIVISQNALRVGHTLRENIRLRIEASTREEALQESKMRLQQLNQNLEQLVAERTSELRENEARFRFLFEQAAVGVAQIDIATGRFVRVNQKYADVVGYTPEEMLALNFHFFVHSADPEAGHVNMNRLTAEETGEFELENRYLRKDGRVIWVKITVSPMRVFGKRPEYHIAVIQDITESKEAEEQINQLAFYDPLTKLPNRRLFLDRLQRAQIRSTRRKTSCAVFFIDLDNFKTLNDTQGHDIGDLLLIEVAERLKGSVRSGDTVARLGGDEFVITVEGLSEDPLQAATEANDIGEKILEAINVPFRLRDFEYHGSSSIGIRSFNDSKISMDDLLKHADAAMYQAKTAGRNTLCFFDPSMQAALEMRASIAVELRQAIARQQFKLYYQRQVNAEGVVVGAEALLRWQHPQRGMVSPMVFIPIAEETGLIVPIGEWVLQVACIQLKQWAEDPVTCRLQLAVNISARQFLQQDFVNQVLKVLAKTGADPFKLKLELTESLVLHDIAHSIEKMQVLCTAGIRFSLDDFGTGHSSLTYLKRLPLDQIKIDKSFINDIATNINDEVIVRTIIVMSHSLGMEVIAEGVETEDQREFLARNGCYMYQGYLFGKPIPIEDFGV